MIDETSGEIAFIAVTSSAVSFAHFCEESGLTFSQELHWPMMGWEAWGGGYGLVFFTVLFTWVMKLEREEREKG